MTTLTRDLRLAIRRLRKNRAFTLVAVLTLALGIGASTSIFTVVNAVLLRPLGYADPDRLVVLWNRLEATGNQRAAIAAPDVAEYRRRARLVDDFAFVGRITDAGLSTGSGEAAEHVRVRAVSPNLFDLLGVEAALGRAPRPGEGIVPRAVLEDTTATPPPAKVLLADGLWRRRFGGDPEVVGRPIELDGGAAVVAGVLPPGFALRLPREAGAADRIDVWTPVRLALSEMRRPDRLHDQDSDNTGAVLGRLKPGVTLAQARAEMAGIARRQRAESAAHRKAGVSIELKGLRRALADPIRPILLALGGAVGLVLLIACINVANLVLARSISRRREMALRSALGADRGRIVRQLLTENAVLALLGGGLGLLLSYWALDALLAVKPADIPVAGAVAIDWRVLLFTLAVTTLAAVIFGLLPALEMSAGDGSAALRARSDPAGGGSGRRSALVAAQIALSLVLLMGAGLLFRSLNELRDVDPGFEPRGALAFDLVLRHSELYPGPADRARLVRRLEDRLAELPGVEAVGVSGSLPLSGRTWTQPFGLPGQAVRDWRANEANFRMVTSGYFDAIGTRVLAGRGFTRDEDVHEERRVVIVDRTMAERIAPDGRAVGRRIGFPLDGEPVTAEVVGTVENVRYEDLRGQRRGTLYVPYRQEASREIAVVVRTAAVPSTRAHPVRRTVAAVAPEFPIHGLRPLQDHVARATAPVRYTLTLISGFAAAALVLATIGLWGVIAFSVGQRTREIGVRMALGATGGRLVRDTALWGLRLAGVGVTTGVAAALILTPALSELLFGVRPFDAPTYAGAALLVTAVALAACYLPARRAGRVDPVVALRADR